LRNVATSVPTPVGADSPVRGQWKDSGGRLSSSSEGSSAIEIAPSDFALRATILLLVWCYPGNASPVSAGGNAERGAISNGQFICSLFAVLIQELRIRVKNARVSSLVAVRARSE
jgi:hypothetical protein